MSSQPLPRLLAGPRAACALSIALMTTTGGAALAPPTADAKLIPPPGPWPTTVNQAGHPLAGTTFAPQGGAYTPRDADLRVWTPSHGKRLMTITRTVGDETVIRGRLRNRATRHSIAGATVTLVMQDVHAGEWNAIANATTNRSGAFRMILPPGYHRRAAVLYYPAIGAAPIFSRRLLIRAKTRVDLTIPVHNRRAYRFDGHVSAGDVPVPPSGLLLALQVRNRRGTWITARLARTTPTGRFRIRYTFPTPGRLKIRITVPSQTAWELYAGHSPTRTIAPR